MENRTEKILFMIRDLNDMVNDTYKQLSKLGDRVSGGCLTCAQAKEFEQKWTDYIERSETIIASLKQELFKIAEERGYNP